MSNHRYQSFPVNTDTDSNSQSPQNSKIEISSSPISTLGIRDFYADRFGVDIESETAVHKVPTSGFDENYTYVPFRERMVPHSESVSVIASSDQRADARSISHGHTSATSINSRYSTDDKCNCSTCIAESEEDARIRAHIRRGAFLDISPPSTPAVALSALRQNQEDVRDAFEEMVFDGWRRHGDDEWHFLHGRIRTPPSSPVVEPWSGAERLPLTRLELDLDENFECNFSSEAGEVETGERRGGDGDGVAGWPLPDVLLLVDREREIGTGRLRTEDEFNRAVRDVENRVHDVVDVAASTLTGTSPPPSNAAQFLSSLPIIPFEDLAEDRQSCTICQEPYLTGSQAEEAVVIPQCGHTFGRVCIGHWLGENSGGSNKNTCPMCRAILFEKNNDESLPTSPQGMNSLGVFGEGGNDLGIASLACFLEGVRNVNDHFDDIERHGIGHRPAPRTPGPFASPDLSQLGGNSQHDFLLSSRILALFRYFIEDRVDSDDLVQIAQALAGLMGRLFLRLEGAMEREECPVMWRERGPPVSFLIDPAAAGLVEVGLERLEEVELGER